MQRFDVERAKEHTERIPSPPLGETSEDSAALTCEAAEPLLDCEEPHLSKGEGRSGPQPISLHGWLLVLIMVLQIIVLLTGFSSRDHAHSSTVGHTYQSPDNRLHSLAQQSNDCGTTWQEASKAGCVWDLLRFAWTPAKCHNSTAHARAVATGPWPWYKDPEGKHPLHISDLQYQTKAYTNWKYHLDHCRYTFQLAHTAQAVRGWVPGDVALFDHSTHCGILLADESVIKEDLGPVAYTAFSFCVPLEDYQ